MDKIKDSDLYKEDIKSILRFHCNWDVLRNKKILITGATGLIGIPLVDMFILLNKEFSLNLHLYLVSRHNQKSTNDFVNYINHDISQPLNIPDKFDYIIHAASNTHPLQYSANPIETITTNVYGTMNLLELASQNNNCRFVLISSVEVYGDDFQELKSGFAEDDFGYLDCNSSRSCYNESKRLSETLCAAYNSEKNIDYVICRICRTYGPTLKKDDTKALSQFLHNAVNKKDIVLKSKGNQLYSYIYSSDAASAIIFILLNGESKNAYNVSDKQSNITLKELTLKISHITNTNVIFDAPSEKEINGYSKANRAILNPEKLYKMNWRPKYNIDSGIPRTIEIMRKG